MRRWMYLPLLVCAAVNVAFAQDAPLRPLDTLNGARAWEAVGRLDIGGRGFCTGALIAPDLVLTAAHCLFDRTTKSQIDFAQVEFLAGWRNGRASAYRGVRRAVIHPDYVFDGAVSSARVHNDLALLELAQPIRNTTVVPFETGARPRRGDEVGIVSYAKDRAEAPALQEVCRVLSQRDGILITTCNVDFGSSGAPIFTFAGGSARIVSVVSAKAEVKGEPVSLGTALAAPLADLRRVLSLGGGYRLDSAPVRQRVKVGGARHETGAKFIKP